MDELSLVFVRRDATQEAPGPFVAGLAGPLHSRRGVLAGGSPDAPGVDGWDPRDRRARCLAVMQDPRLVVCETSVHCLVLIIVM